MRIERRVRSEDMRPARPVRTLPRLGATPPRKAKSSGLEVGKALDAIDAVQVEIASDPRDGVLRIAIAPGASTEFAPPVVRPGIARAEILGAVRGGSWTAPELF